MWWSRVLRVGWLIGLLGCQGEPDFALELHHPEGWIGHRPAVELPCRPALTGEVVINEVMVRPTGLDLDEDGAVNSGDEYIEVISRATEPVHLDGVTLWFGGDNRGELSGTACVGPRSGALVVGSKTAAPSVPPGVSVFHLSRTLRLSDRAGVVELRGQSGGALDVVNLAEPPKSSGVVNWSRARDGDWYAELRQHSELSSRPWSPGRCSSGHQLPECLAWIDGQAERAERRR